MAKRSACLSLALMTTLFVTRIDDVEVVRRKSRVDVTASLAICLTLERLDLFDTLQCETHLKSNSKLFQSSRQSSLLGPETDL